MINLGYLLVLYSCKASYANLQLPEGGYAKNLWMNSDVMTYVQPARNFLAYGIFGDGLVPDYHRTIGYPLLIAGAMKAFGIHWLLAMYLFQAIFCATVYPALTQIGTILFKNAERAVILTFVFLVAAGAYVVGVPAILTDTVFAVCFISGVCFGLQAMVKQSWKFTLLHVGLIGYAAQIRPVLVLFPFINVLLLWMLAHKRHLAGSARTKVLLAGSTCALLLLCNAPSIRNYINYRLFMPSDLLAVNMFDFLGKRFCRQRQAGHLRRNVAEN